MTSRKKRPMPLDARTPAGGVPLWFQRSHRCVSELALKLLRSFSGICYAPAIRNKSALWPKYIWGSALNQLR
jgi:hypothetical protein